MRHLVAHSRAQFNRSGAAPSDRSDLSDLYRFKTAPAPVVANTMICLIHQDIYLIKGQLGAQAKAFLAEGGFRERMHRERLARRDGATPT